MKCMEVNINLHEIKNEFMKEFIMGVECHRLQNCMLEHVMDFSLSKKNIDPTFLMAAQSMLFTNQAIWEPHATNSHSLLYNGNHQFQYIQYTSDWVMLFNN
jgi:hypothetical protein